MCVLQNSTKQKSHSSFCCLILFKLFRLTHSKELMYNTPELLLFLAYYINQHVVDFFLMFLVGNKIMSSSNYFQDETRPPQL